jgi:hypothetical protein
MTEPRNDDRSQARREAATLLGADVDHLSPVDSLRVDMISALRLVIDHEQASVLSGGGADLGKLNVAVQSLIALLPGRELPAPAEQHHQDPRLVMWQIYKQMRERGEIGLKALPPEGDSQHRIDELEAENERLKARLAGKTLEHSDVPMVVERVPRGSSTAIDLAEADIVPPSEIGECYLGIERGPDDPPRRSTTVIEGRAVPKPPSAPAAPQYDYNREQGWKDYVEADGTIRPTPRGRGHYWGPV